ncbi:unnamed protein product [Diamesa serratosioi]
MLTIIHYTSGFSEVIMEYAEEIKGITNLTDFSKIKVSKVNRTTHLWMGDMTLFVDVGDDYKFESTLFKKVGMGYHKTPYKMGPKDFCKYWNDDAFFYPDMLKVSDLPAQGTWQAVFGYVEVVMINGGPMDTDPSFADFSKLRVKKVNRTHGLYGELNFKQELTNDIRCEIVLFKKQGGEYRKTQFKLPGKGFCDFYNSETFVVPDFQNYCLNCPKQEEKICPWKAQIYNVEQYTFKAKDIPPYLEAQSYHEISLTVGEPLVPNDISVVDYSKLRVKKMNRTHHFVDGEMTTFVELNNDYQYEFVVFKKQGNIFKKQPYKLSKMNYCDFHQRDVYFYDDLLKHSDLPAKGVCPWPIATYHIHEYLLNIDAFPPVFNGEYRVDIQVMKDEKIVTGYRLFGSIILTLV